MTASKQRRQSEKADDADHDPGRQRIADPATDRLPAGMSDVDRRRKRAAEQSADNCAGAVGQQYFAQAVIVSGGRSALDVVHALGEIIDAERHGGDEQRPDIANRLGEISGRVGEAQTELAESGDHLGGLHQFIEMHEFGEPGEDSPQQHRHQASGQPERQANAGHPADQHDRQREHEEPRVFPSEKGRPHRDEGDRDAGEGPEHRRARRVFAHGRSDKGAQQDDDADDEAPDEAHLPGKQWVVRLQIDWQHDQEDDDEHVRHARPVGHRRHIRPAGAFGQPPGEIGVIEVAQWQGDAQGRQDPGHRRCPPAG